MSTQTAAQKRIDEKKAQVQEKLVQLTHKQHWAFTMWCLDRMVNLVPPTGNLAGYAVYEVEKLLAFDDTGHARVGDLQEAARAVCSLTVTGAAESMLDKDGYASESEALAASEARELSELESHLYKLRDMLEEA